MTGTERSASEGFVCPNCQTLNNPNAELCISCGIHFHLYDEVKQEISVRINDRKSEFLKIVQEETQQKLKNDQKSSKREFLKKLIFLLIICVVLVPVFLGALKLVQHQKIVRQQFLETNYQKAVDCLDAEDFQCANDLFQEVYSRQKDFKDTRELLISSQIGIADSLFENSQYSRAIDLLNDVIEKDARNLRALTLLSNCHKSLGDGYKNEHNWQKAIDEYSLALVAMPDDFSVRNAVNETYTLWIQEVRSGNNLFRFLDIWKIQWQQDKFNNP